MRALIVALALLVSSQAAGQPMMMDPSKMSGIPRPDPQVPAGTITVRLIRGQLSNRVVGQEVILSGPDGKSTIQKTDAEGRATFAGLSGAGPFVAGAKDGEHELRSQPIELSAQMGSRVMLVFAASGAGAPDGQGHPDKSLPAGTIVVRAEDAAGQGIEGLAVTLGHARAGEQTVVELKGKTDVAGEAKFEGLDRKPTSGYIAEVTAKGTRFAGKPFKLEENVGARVVLTIRAVSGDTSALSFADGSHLLVEVTDDTLQVIEVFRLHNSGSAAFDAGPEGLHLPLPRDALQIQAPDMNASLSISGHDAIVRGPLPPGETQLRVAFSIPYHGGQAELTQPTPVPFSRVALVTQQLEGLTVTGQQVTREEREMQGRKLVVYFGTGTDKDGELRLTFTGLPHADPTPRYVAAGLSVLLVLLFGVYAAGGGGAARSRLERERRMIFDELVEVDGVLADSAGVDAARRAKLGERRGELVSRLADVYRGLDELGGRVTVGAGAANEPIVRARGLYQAYGRQAALRGVDLDLGRGEAIALLGPNGAGKSTLLRLLSSLERPQRGMLSFSGHDADEEVRRAIGVVAHESLCYGDLSARENLEFFGGLYDVPDVQARTTALLGRVALTAAADRPARTYSRGMLQRLAVARALIHRPMVLLLDEPFTGLDRQGTLLLAELLLEEKRRGASLIVVSHDLPAVAQLVDRVLVLARGRIECDEALGQGDRLAALERLYDSTVSRLSGEPAIAGSGAA